MALTQTARIPGPSWDEEVVPALRKRLEIESRTIARRLSGMSLLNADNQINSTLASVSARDTAPQYGRSSEDTRLRNGYQPSRSSQGSAASSSSRTPLINSSKKPTTARSRTLSQPYGHDSINAKLRPKPRGSARPTRIPKVSKAAPSMPNSPITISYSNELGQLHTNPSLSTLEGLGHQVSGILDEPAPFRTGTMSSASKSQSNLQLDEAPPRSSNDSEERPFEHWYRGEVSRNGGVGELRVGRRQEMLDIANYGHNIAKRQDEASIVTTTTSTTHDDSRRRKRADSVGGIRRDRDSVYLDDEHMGHIGRVLDENPLTDLDGESDDSDTQSMGDRQVESPRQAYNYTSHQIGDISTASEPPLYSAYDSRSSTPTPTTVNRPSIQQNGSSRTPATSPTRQSADSRSTTPVQIKRGISEVPSSSRSTPSTPRAQRQRPKDAPPPSSMQKRGISPMSPAKKSKSPGGKAARPKAAKPKKEMTEEEKRRSVAVYPLSAGDGDMADAIPSWTQPKLKEGNWDEVVLPVVARKKGLEEHYEQADGSPQPKKINKPIEPAPGTFGFDHSKYRPLRDQEDIPMDEFGRPNVEEKQEEEVQESWQVPVSVSHDEIRLPVRHERPPSLVPFADYVPIKGPQTTPLPVPMVLEDQQHELPEEDKDSAGCCKCVIM
ncbi:hypothetical protein AX15_002641 [Amanita polypyramis BW_CC]|nr:hypothetical protein AX15_002641 [Amanita polypyramis BW_CC]